MSLQYRNKSKSQLTSPTPAQLRAVALSAGRIVYHSHHAEGQFNPNPVEKKSLLILDAPEHSIYI
jgi:hypothetical protein